MTPGDQVRAPIRGLCDGADRLVTADEALARLHGGAGGSVAGTLALPALRAGASGPPSGLAQTREVTVLDGDQPIVFQRARFRKGRAWPWPCTTGAGAPSITTFPADPAGLWHHLAQGHVLLDPGQRVIAVDCRASDLADVEAGLASALGHWALALGLPEGRGWRACTGACSTTWWSIWPGRRAAGGCVCCRAWGRVRSPAPARGDPWAGPFRSPWWCAW
jgi:hypothetical protein